MLNFFETKLCHLNDSDHLMTILSSPSLMKFGIIRHEIFSPVPSKFFANSLGRLHFVKRVTKRQIRYLIDQRLKVPSNINEASFFNTTFHH